jgi:hypothetical protein
LALKCPGYGVTSDLERWEIKRVSGTKAQYSIKPKGKQNYCSLKTNGGISCVGKPSIDDTTNFTFHRNGDKYNIKAYDGSFCKGGQYTRCGSDLNGAEWKWEISPTDGIDKISKLGATRCQDWGWLDTPGNKCVFVRGVGHIKLDPNHPNLANFGQVYDKNTNPRPGY